MNAEDEDIIEGLNAGTNAELRFWDLNTELGKRNHLLLGCRASLLGPQRRNHRPSLAGKVKEKREEAYGGLSSVFIWMLVAHSAQREIRERHHYTVDCIVAIYVGIMLWKMTGFLWPLNSKRLRLKKLEKIEGKLYQAAKDSDLEQVRDLLQQVSSTTKDQVGKERAMRFFAGGTIVFALTVVVLAFVLTSDG